MTEQFTAHTTHRFAYPVEQVYQAFVDPKLLALWFGPLGFHVPAATVEVDARVGGAWNMTMVSNDDPEWTSRVTSTLREIEENRVIVGSETAHGIPGVEDGTELSLTLEFAADGDGTIVTLTQGPFPEVMRDMNIAGWTQSFHKLEALLGTPKAFFGMS
ncbi:SRPBCC domain-containing protein [Curtobacterium sp. ISL-83]|uniref:SRPBCC family protein n=1 Tax=Curtobacterium sp. ISL-83 TaxID=2819145 RepID=UPI001BE5DFAC|nr:SRPBCC domain-containing protein [Curtobacterium sp. ISL-83]MBT2502473.1 SRPBCC domain-containing protein [Curtobacterium sp. ISL-83]